MFVLMIGEWFVSRLELGPGELPVKIEINSKCWLAKSYSSRQAAYIDMRAIQNDIDYAFKWPVKIKEI